MGLGALREGQLIRWQQRVLKLMGRLPSGDWLLSELSTGLIDHQKDKDLLLAIEKRELTFICEEDGAGKESTRRLVATLGANAVVGTTAKEGDKSEKAADCRMQYVVAILEKSREKAIESIQKVWEKLQWPQKRPGYSTVCLWRQKADGASDQIAALKDRDSTKGRWGDRYTNDAMNIIRDVRDLHFLKRNPRIKMAKALEYVKSSIVLENQTRPAADRLPIPKRKAFLKVLAEVPMREQLALRFGPDYARRAMRISLGGVETTRPLQRVEVDHTPLGAFLLDEDFLPWGRANTSLALEAHCVMPLGVYWGAEVPSIVSVARCMRHSVEPKIDFMSKYPNVKGSWEAYGLAETYIGDNGLEEHAQALRQACSEMGGAAFELCPRAAPWYKPNVERFFRTQDLDLLQGLPGATMENFLTRSDFDPKKDMLLRRSSFGRIFVKWIVDIHMRKRLASLGNLSPVEAWRKDIGLTEQFVPTRTILLERLFLRDVDGDKRPVLDHEGIEFDCLIYNSAELGALRSQTAVKMKVRIRVSDEDLGHIYVCVPNHDIWIMVPCLNQKYARGLTRWQHEKCKKMQRVQLDEGYELTLAESRQEIINDIENEKEEFRQAHRKKRSRFKEKGHGSDAQKEASTPEEREPDRPKRVEERKKPLEIPVYEVSVAD